ncbi:hypothetical protein [Streptomyces turgidiscabies]|uniref:hypothetical protein n=1 Tax=Streptomyces turgidiscabies TaxID=85558 RepID=UPI0038F75F90
MTNVHQSPVDAPGGARSERGPHNTPEAATAPATQRDGATAADTVGPLNDERLADIEARANAATPGPWTSWADTYPHVVTQGSADIHPFDAEGIVSTNLAVNVAADAEFVAHARTDVPAMAAEIRRLRRQRKYLVGQLAKRDAETGRGDQALKEFLRGETATP